MIANVLRMAALFVMLAVVILAMRQMWKSI